MTLLSADGVSVRFGGLRALNDVSATVQPDAITGLIGPNGAGKSTLLSVLSGLQRPDAGRVLLDGEDITRLAPHARARRGMARTFQRLELWGSMSVRDNIRTVAELSSNWRSGVHPGETADELIERLLLQRVAHVPAGSLSSGTARVVEVARALASGPRLLLLDEPSAGLDDHESAQLTDTLIATAAGGTAILLVEHHVEMVMRACSHIYVLDFGTIIADGPPEAIRSSEAVQTAYLGSYRAS